MIENAVVNNFVFGRPWNEFGTSLIQDEIKYNFLFSLLEYQGSAFNSQ